MYTRQTTRPRDETPPPPPPIVSADVLIVKVLVRSTRGGGQTPPRCAGDGAAMTRFAPTVGGQALVSELPINNRVHPKQTFTVDPFAEPTGTHTTAALSSPPYHRVYNEFNFFFFIKNNIRTTRRRAFKSLRVWSYKNSVSSTDYIFCALL